MPLEGQRDTELVEKKKDENPKVNYIIKVQSESDLPGSSKV